MKHDKNDAFSEEALKQAAALVRQSMLDSMPPPSQCGHEFSPAFQAKMERLTAQSRFRTRVRGALRRVAVVVLAVLVGTGVCLTFNAEARAAFLSWTREVYESIVTYRFFGEPEAEALPAYRLSWVPEGYQAVDIYDGEDAYNAWYQIGDDVFSGFIFEYFFIEEGGTTILDMGETEYIHKTFELNGAPAELYLSLDPGETSDLLWFDEDMTIVFTINGFLDEAVILRMAESVILTDSTK